MDDLMRVAIVIVTLVGTGVIAYAGVALVSALSRRLQGRAESPSAEQLDALHARLAAVETLEARVGELEERLDFAERLLSSQEPRVLPSGPRTGAQ